MEQQSNLDKTKTIVRNEIKELNNSKGKNFVDNKNNPGEEVAKKQERDKNSNFKYNNNIIFIGSKPLVNYIKGVITQFIKKDSSEVIIKSRGRFISKAVDVAEVSKRTLADKNIKVKSINISSESFETEGKRTNISTMDIVLGK